MVESVGVNSLSWSKSPLSHTIVEHRRSLEREEDLTAAGVAMRDNNNIKNIRDTVTESNLL